MVIKWDKLLFIRAPGTVPRQHKCSINILPSIIISGGKRSHLDFVSSASSGRKQVRVGVAQVEESRRCALKAWPTVYRLGDSGNPVTPWGAVFSSVQREWWHRPHMKYLSEPVKRTLVASKWPPMVRVGKQHINLSVIRGLWATLTCVPPWSLPLNVRKCMCTEPTGRVCFPAGQFICSSMTSGNSQPLCLHFLVINWSRHFTHLPTVS